MKKYVNMKTIMVKNLKTGTNWFKLRHQDSIPKTGTVPAKLAKLKKKKK